MAYRTRKSKSKSRSRSRSRLRGGTRRRRLRSKSRSRSRLRGGTRRRRRRSRGGALTRRGAMLAKKHLEENCSGSCDIMKDCAPPTDPEVVKYVNMLKEDPEQRELFEKWCDTPYVLPS